MFVKITIIKSVSIFITIVIINNIANCGIVVAIKLFVEHQYINIYIYVRNIYILLLLTYIYINITKTNR